MTFFNCRIFLYLVLKEDCLSSLINHIPQDKVIQIFPRANVHVASQDLQIPNP